MWQAQARMVKEQQRVERARLKMQRRMWRRRSIAGPLLLVGLGVVFLMVQTGHLAWVDVVNWYERWWPAILIVAGLVMVAEWAFDRSRGEGYPAAGRRLGGGVVLLMVMLLGFGLITRAAMTGALPSHSALRDGWHDLARMAGERRTSDSSMSSPLPAGAGLTIRVPRGDVTISGTSTDGQVHVNVETQVYAWTNHDAERIEHQVAPQFSQQGWALVLQSSRSEGGRTDLTVQTPKNVSISVESGEGDVSLDGVQGQVTISADHGDVTLNNLTGQVTTRMHYDNGGVTAKNIQGPVSVEGRVGDVNLADVNGAVILQGDFFGESSLQHISGPARFQSSRTQFECTRIDDQLEIEGGPEMQASGLVGPVVLKTSNRNITLDRVQGSVQIQNKNGSVAVTSALPLAPISIQNQHGSIDLGVPEKAVFSLNAQTRNGDIENDFSLDPQGEKENRWVQGNVAGGGTAISLTTSDGDIVVRKSSAAMAAPAGPAAPPAPPAPPAPGVGAKGHHKTVVKEETF
jgi:DUF4097 and DUF4098 domain-containing protein YvlB